MIFKMKCANFDNENILNHASKKYEKISPDRESIVLLDNTFHKKFGHILAAILAILHCRSNFSMKKQENLEFYAFILEFDAIFNSGCKL